MSLLPNATSQQRDGTQASFKTTKDIFQNELHNIKVSIFSKISAKIF
jgi:hypothetical protein